MILRIFISFNYYKHFNSNQYYKKKRNSIKLDNKFKIDLRVELKYDIFRRKT
jgi:hypothetical protein